MSLISSKKADTNRVELEVSIDAEAFSKATDRAYAKSVKKINLPGFRPGKAPRHMIEKMYGEEFFFEDAVNELYPQALSEAIDEAKLDVIKDRIDLDIKSMSLAEGVVFTAVVTVKPEVKLEQYKGLEAKKKAVSISDADVDAEIEKIRDRNSRLIAVEDRATAEGDTVVFDFEGFKDGVPFDGGKAEKFSLVLGSGQFIPGFEDQMIGKNKDDEFEITVTFPEDYGAAELAGQPAVFKIKIHEIKMKELPELDDEFAKDVSEFDTLAEYKDDTKKKLTEKAEKAADDEFRYNVQQVLIDAVEADIPDAMFENRCDSLLEEFGYSLSAQGLDLATYLKYTGMDADSFRTSMRPKAVNQVKLRLALEKVAELEGITATEEELNEELEKIAKSYSVSIEDIKKTELPSEVEKDIVADKAMNFVFENAVVVEGE